MWRGEGGVQDVLCGQEMDVAGLSLPSTTRGGGGVDGSENVTTVAPERIGLPHSRPQRLCRALKSKVP